MELPVLQPEERVLTTLESDGSRHWIYPKLATGRFWRWRRVVAYALITIYALLPFLKIDGKPAILLDLGNREFTFFGFTFLPTDTVLLALFVVALFLFIFFITAIAGRVWCGWACPQTVYMEFVFRPLERFFTGTSGRGGKAKKSVPAWRLAAMYLAYFVICLHLSNMFLAYFVGVDKLHAWIWTSHPGAHPGAFAVVAVVTGLMMFDFCYWREQLCIIGCPYGRFQSVMLDRSSCIIGYDEERGEPRGKGRDRDELNLGSCVDCGLCVDVCPTGIDIRQGLQLECIGCAQCIDVCDDVMRKTDQPIGLIRYSSQQGLEGKPTRIIRPRTLIYLTVITLLVTGFFTVLVNKSAFDVTVLRGLGKPFLLSESGDVENILRVKIVNRAEESSGYRIEVIEPAEAKISSGSTVEVIDPGLEETQPVHIHAPRYIFRAGKVDLKLRIIDDQDRVVEERFFMLGPL
ncbi:cytochrome c oxidase accessory protein CcoG [Aeoliella mucimassa]|uniref:4Fe-4S binding domain protein n=1 Tax=Aeoliella mucimassa TaxID=2527972 RepID=A0A518ALZ7_9BACT|nr:cytochrome c oxidase accessory protein CcoG [Aeoliella mucimassa]QDU55755.1 4Fe-4S binding domain protein [Aeoliella mucimassa]